MMQQQMEQQFERLQHGLTAALGNGAQLTDPIVRSNKVLLGSFSQLLRDQFEFGQACMDISRKQMKKVAGDGDFTALFDARGVATAYYAAVSKYGEAVRRNAQDTHQHMATIRREVTTAVADFAQGAVSEQAPTVAAKPAVAKAEKPARKTPKKAAGKATGNSTGSQPKKAPARKAAAKANAKADAKAEAKAPAKVSTAGPAAADKPAADVAAKAAKPTAGDAVDKSVKSSSAKVEANAVDQTTANVSDKASKKPAGKAASQAG